MTLVTPAKPDPALLEKCSFQTSAGAHLTAAEVSLMQKNLAIVGKIDKQFLEAQGVTREILTELEKNPGAAANKLREVLQNPGKLLTIEPKQLLRIAADAGVDLTAADAKLLITGADPKLMRMTLVSAAERLEVGYKAPEAAKALRSFLEETRGHVRAVQDSAKIMEKRLPQWKALTEEQLVKEYGMSEKEATALKKEFDSLSPQDFKPAYHDVLGPGSKMKGDVGTFMARPGKPMDEPTIAWAIDRHNATNLHHRPNTPGSRMEGAIDMIAAMRQERVYRPESLPWTGGKEGEDIRTIIFGGGPKRIGNQGMPLEKFKDMMPKRTPPDPAESAWKKLMFKEMQSVDDKMLVRPQDIFKSFVPG